MRWVLSESRGTFLADHVVQVDPTTREYSGFRDLSTYLDYHKPIYPPDKELGDLGAWIGEKLFGGLCKRSGAASLAGGGGAGGRALEAVEDLLFRPFELARFADGTSFGKAGVRFVDPRGDGRRCGGQGAGGEGTAHPLAAFSLPACADPLDLRREGYGSQRLVPT